MKEWIRYGKMEKRSEGERKCVHSLCAFSPLHQKKHVKIDIAFTEMHLQVLTMWYTYEIARVYFSTISKQKWRDGGKKEDGKWNWGGKSGRKKYKPKPERERETLVVAKEWDGKSQTKQITIMCAMLPMKYRSDTTVFTAAATAAPAATATDFRQMQTIIYSNRIIRMHTALHSKATCFTFSPTFSHMVEVW